MKDNRLKRGNTSTIGFKATRCVCATRINPGSITRLFGDKIRRENMEIHKKTSIDGKVVMRASSLRQKECGKGTAPTAVAG